MSVNFPVDSSGLVFSGSIGSLSITGTAATSTSDYAYSKTYYDTSYNEINNRVNNDITNLANNYTNTTSLQANYYTKSTIDNNFNSLNADKLTSGTVSVARGGTGQNSLTSGLILIGNGTSGILQNSNLSWDNTNSRLGIKKTPTCELDVNGTITATSFSGSGASLNNLNVSNASLGTLPLSRGGLVVTSLTANQILIGNGSTSILQSSNLIWDPSNNRLGINKTPSNGAVDVLGQVIATSFSGNGNALTSLSASNISTGIVPIANGGTGTSTFSTGQILIGNGSTSILQTNKLFWDTSNNRLGIGNSAPTNALHITGDARVEGNLIVNGTTTIVNTNVSNSEQLSITNDGTGPALIVNQTGTQPVIQFKDDGAIFFEVKDGGHLGIGTSTKIVNTDISGNLTVSGTITNSALTTSISAKENALTFNAPLTRSTNTIGIDLSSYYTKSQVDTNISTVQTSLNSLIASTNRTSYFSFVLTNSMTIAGTVYYYYVIQLSNYTTKASLVTSASISSGQFRSFKIITFMADGYIESATTTDKKNYYNNMEISMSNLVFAYPIANYPSYYMPSLNIQTNMQDNIHLNKINNDSMGFLLRVDIDSILMLSTSSSTINCIIIDYLYINYFYNILHINEYFIQQRYIRFNIYR